MRATDDFNTRPDEQYIQAMRPELNTNIQKDAPSQKEVYIVLWQDDWEVPTSHFIAEVSNWIEDQPDENWMIYYGRDSEWYEVYKLVA